MNNPLSTLMGYAGPNKPRFALATVLATIGVACSVVPYFAAASIFVSLVSGIATLDVYLFDCGIAALGYLGHIVFGNASTIVAHSAAFGTMRNIRQLMVDKFQRMPMGDLLSTPSGQLANTAVDRVESLESTLAHMIPEMTANVIVPVVLIVYLFVLDWRMALAALAVIVIGLPFMGAMMRGSSMQEGAMKAKQHMNGVIVEFIGGIKVIKTFCQSVASFRKYHDAVLGNASYNYEWMRATELGMAGYMVVWPTTLLTVLPIGCVLFANGSLSAADFITLIVVSLATLAPILSMTTFMSNVMALSLSVGAVAQVLEAPELVRPSALPGDDDPVAADTPTDIELRGVRFSYTKGNEVLHGIDLAIPQGSTTALVGESGGGKSTIARLIAGFWDVSSGSIAIGGMPLQEISQARLSNLVSYIAQENYLFDDTVRNNIRVGRASATDEEVEAVARAAGCEEFILALENGYETRVGGAGSHLSGGERQRVAIARAMLRDAPIVIMDESTAYMDPENEAIVQEAVSRLVAGKTLIVIAHRLSTVTDSDQIVVVEDGHVSAVGTHDALLAGSELYASMWQAHIGAKDSDAA